MRRPASRSPDGRASGLFYQPMPEEAMTTDITPIEADGQFYVNVSLDGHEKQYGPVQRRRRG